MSQVGGIVGDRAGAQAQADRPALRVGRGGEEPAWRASAARGARPARHIPARGRRAIGFSATCELYFSFAILTTDVVVLTLYSYQYMRMMRGGPTI